MTSEYAWVADYPIGSTMTAVSRYVSRMPRSRIMIFCQIFRDKPDTRFSTSFTAPIATESSSGCNPPAGYEIRIRLAA